MGERVAALIVELQREIVELQNQAGDLAVELASARAGIPPLSADEARWIAIVRLGSDYGLDPSGGIIFTRQAPLGSKLWDWILEDWNGLEVVALQQSRIANIGPALLAAIKLRGEQSV